jgi:hypothetical protein
MMMPEDDVEAGEEERRQPPLPPPTTLEKQAKGLDLAGYERRGSFTCTPQVEKISRYTRIWFLDFREFDI